MDNDILVHYGTKRHSGRYPWGSGDVPYQHESWFLNEYARLKKEGLSDTDIAKGMNMSTTEFRAKRTKEKAEKRQYDMMYAMRLKDKGYSNVKIGEMMDIPESSVRNLLNPSLQYKNDILNSTAKELKKAVDEGKYIDIGKGVERDLGISAEKLKSSVAILKEEGYVIQNIQVKQANNQNQKTTVKVLCPPGTTYKDVNSNHENIHLLNEHSYDGGKTWRDIYYPQSIDSKRVYIRYLEEGGNDKEGVIELRKGVPDLEMGNSRYAQVRIAVDDSKYMKGMAIYSDDIPKGYDVVYNTKKSKDIPKDEIFKDFKRDKSTGEIDRDNPFGASLKVQTGQHFYKDKNGKEHLSAINIVNEEGDWSEWSSRKTIASQMLSKQDVSVAQKQLTVALRNKQQEYEEISSITNPVIKRKLLESFADDCDSSAVHLKAAAFPRQASHVILPLTSIKENEIYAPNYRNGEKVVLIRYPHGGIFEIPELRVNNKNAEGIDIIGSNSRDAVGIHPKVAGILSGADFDGDSVIVIPNNKGSIKRSSPLAGLKDFDTNIYKYTNEYTHDKAEAKEKGLIFVPKMKDATKQNEMGRITNLITDMTIKGADEYELARAVRHSMVIIDAQKHDLNYHQSFIDNDISSLKKKYQPEGGVGTLISRAKSEVRVDERKIQKGQINIDPKTGEKIFKYTGASYVNNKGKLVKRQTKTTKMAEAKDAFELSSGTAMENVYASYANQLKSLANKSRLDILNLPKMKYEPNAKEIYAKEVATLNAHLNESLKNAPRERQALLLAESIMKIKKADNPDMTKDEIKKLSDQTMAAARARVGAKKKKVPISEKEWEAIQAGAITGSKLTQIINNSDLDELKKLATPRSYTNSLTPAKLAQAQAWLNSGYTQAEVADMLNISASTLMRNLIK